MTREDWIGDLPSDWTLTRLGALGSLAKGSGGSKEDNRDSGIPVVRYGEIYSKFDRVIRNAQSFISPEASHRYTPLATGSLVFAASGEDPEEIGKAALSLLSSPAFVGGDSVVFTPRKNAVDPVYLTYVLDSEPLRAQKAIRSTGFTVVHISAGKLKTLPIPLPHLDEQRAIADYLDHETAQIDALVAKQEELIELLRERRRIVVPTILSEAKLTDPRPDKLHRRTRMGNGSTPRSGEDRYYVEGTVAWVNSSVVNQLEVWEPSKQVTQKAIDECHLPIVKPGSILVALTGQGKTRGAATILRITSTINQHLAFIEPDKSYWHPEYLLWALRSHYDYLRRISSENGATKGGLTVGDLRELKVSMPDLDEQSRLVDKLEDASGQIDTLIAKAEEHIVLAKERRAALITAAVTGQFDVRTARKAG